MGARIAAVLAALVMVVGAVVVRERVIEADDNGASPNGGDSVAVVCARELPDGVCDREADFGGTVTSLLQPESRATESWVAAGPWPTAVEFSEKRFDEVVGVADTRLVAVVLKKPAACAGAITWRCLGDAAGSGGRVSAPSSSTGVRVLIRAALLGGYVDRTDYAINDLDEVEGARDWLLNAEEGIEQARRRQAATLSDFVAARGAAADVFLTTEVEALAAGVEENMVVPTTEARVVATLGRVGDVDVAEIRERLVAAGWRAATAGGSSGLPSAGVLLALREVTR